MIFKLTKSGFVKLSLSGYKKDDDNIELMVDTGAVTL